MTTFQRARTAQQREVRRQHILETAEAMLQHYPVADLSLNALSRRIGLAKSNVMRYFESREAILLEVLLSHWRAWLAELPLQLEAGIAARTAPFARSAQFAAILSDSLIARPMLCDLFSAQAGVLEQNVSAQVADRYKRQSLELVQILALLLRRHLPELAGAEMVVSAQIIMTIGAVWTHARPSASMQEAYAADPTLEALHLAFIPTVQQMVTTLLIGTIARQASDTPMPTDNRFEIS